MKKKQENAFGLPVRDLTLISSLRMKIERDIKERSENNLLNPKGTGKISFDNVKRRGANVGKGKLDRLQKDVVKHLANDFSGQQSNEQLSSHIGLINNSSSKVIKGDRF